jgi:hypothetical protein
MSVRDEVRRLGEIRGARLTCGLIDVCKHFSFYWMRWANFKGALREKGVGMRADLPFKRISGCWVEN